MWTHHHIPFGTNVSFRGRMSVSPFQEFRRWLRHASMGERAGTAIATLIVVAILGWTLVPAAQSGTTGTPFPTTGSPTADGGVAIPGAPSGVSSLRTGGTAAPGVLGVPGVPGPGAAGRSVASGTADGAVMSASAAPGSVAQGGCTSPPGNAPGITAAQIKIAIIEVGIFG